MHFSPTGEINHFRENTWKISENKLFSPKDERKEKYERNN
jgi:hypothetical protein